MRSITTFLVAIGCGVGLSAAAEPAPSLTPEPLPSAQPASTVMPMGPPSREAPVVLKRVPLVTEGLELEVTAEACVDGVRKIVTTLACDGQRVPSAGRHVSEWTAGCEVQPAPQGNTSVPWEWSLGTEASACSARVQSVRLSSKLAGALISLECGFEHLHRQHELLTIVGDRVQRVWRGGDVAGPSWTGAEVIDASPTAQAIAFTSEFACGCEVADRYELSRAQWDAGAKTMREKLEPVFLVVYATVPTVEEGRSRATTLRDASEACGDLNPFVLAASDFPKLAPRGFVVAEVAANDSDAKAKLARARECGVQTDAYVKRGR